MSASNFLVSARVAHASTCSVHMCANVKKGSTSTPSPALAKVCGQLQIKNSHLILKNNINRSLVYLQMLMSAKLKLMFVEPESA